MSRSSECQVSMSSKYQDYLNVEVKVSNINSNSKIICVEIWTKSVIRYFKLINNMNLLNIFVE